MFEFCFCYAILDWSKCGYLLIFDVDADDKLVFEIVQVTSGCLAIFELPVGHQNLLQGLLSTIVKPYIQLSSILAFQTSTLYNYF